MNNNFDINRLNALMDAATNAIACGPDCQRERTAEQLQERYIAARRNLVLAEPEYEVARQNYYTYVAGENEYNEMRREELETTADTIIDNFQNTYQEQIDDIRSQLETYNGIIINFVNVVDLANQYKKENAQLTKQLKDETNDVLTNDRKTFYEDQQNQALNGYYYYILLVIYIIVLLCFIIFSFVFPSQTSFNVKIGLIILFALLPFISTWLLGTIIYLLHAIYNILPKNVYN